MNMCNETTVYLTKVFSDLTAQSCPLMSQLIADPCDFDQQLTLLDDHNDRCSCNCGCSCNCCGCGCCGSCQAAFEITDDTDFVIESTEVFVSDFDLSDPCSLKPCDVTVDGLPVDSIDLFNQRYMAATNDLMSRVGDCECMERGRSTKAFLLISGAGSWNARLTIVLRGSAFGCSGCRRFKLVLVTKNCVTIDIPGTSSFATDICLPCTTGGIAPVINFSFKAKARLLNPVLRPAPGPSQCALHLCGSLITEPEAEIQVTRQTLFRTTAESVNMPCDDLAKCRQASGRCENCEDDDDSRAFRLRGRCCDDGCDEHEEEDHHDCDCDCDCGCGRERGESRQSRRGRDDDDCEDRRRRDDDCDCGCGREGRRGDDDDCDCGCRNRSRSTVSRNRSISCQWNGSCGCNF